MDEEGWAPGGGGSAPVSRWTKGRGSYLAGLAHGLRATGELHGVVGRVIWEGGPLET